MKTSIALLTALLLSGGVASAVTPREAFQKQVAKVAPAADAKGKALCACTFDSGPGFANRVGFIRQLVQNNQVVVTCAGATFDAAGEATGGSFACSDFYPLVK